MGFYVLYNFGLGARITPSPSSGKDITIRIWLEGNDPECIAFGEGAVAGKSLLANISFGVDE